MGQSRNQIFNRQVKNSADRFDNDFTFQLAREEWTEILKCKNITSNWEGDRKLPFAFAEQGIYMLMTVLRSDLATRQSKTVRHWAVFHNLRLLKKHKQINILII